MFMEAYTEIHHQQSFKHHCDGKKMNFEMYFPDTLISYKKYMYCKSILISFKIGWIIAFALFKEVQLDLSGNFYWHAHKFHFYCQMYSVNLKIVFLPLQYIYVIKVIFFVIARQCTTFLLSYFHRKSNQYNYNHNLRTTMVQK